MIPWLLSAVRTQLCKSALFILQQFLADISVLPSFSDPFTDEHRKLIDGAIIEVQQALKEKRFDPLPLHLYDYFNKTVTSPFTVKPSNEIESITRKAVVQH